jgi:hypothetical protein
LRVLKSLPLILLFLLKIDIAHAATVSCEITTTQTTRPEYTPIAKGPHKGEISISQEGRALASTSADRLSIITKNKSQNWNLIKEFNQDRGRLKLIVDAFYDIHDKTSINPNTGRLYEFFSITFKIVEEDKTTHTVSFNTDDAHGLPNYFSIAPIKEFDFKGDFIYSFGLSCTNKTKQG